jgi:hypothetical protein
MANRGGHRRFGNVRRRESGRYQIRYPGPDGRMRMGPDTYGRKSDANRALVMIEAQIRSGEWTDPERGKVKLGDYGSAWITERPGLRPRTMEAHRALPRRDTGRKAVNPPDPGMARHAAGQRRVRLGHSQGIPTAPRHHDDRGGR